MPAVQRYTPLALSIFIALVFGQSLFFKFTSAPESLHIFQTIENWIGLAFFEPGMRYLIGVAELVFAVLVLVPATRIIGAMGALIVISGALFVHIASPLGVLVKGDPTLFILAVGVFLSSIGLLYLLRDQFEDLLKDIGLR